MITVQRQMVPLNPGLSQGDYKADKEAHQLVGFVEMLRHPNPQIICALQEVVGEW